MPDRWSRVDQYVTPIQIENTDTLTLRCEHDNSNQNRLALALAPDVAVTFGEGSTDEMCLGSIQMVDQLP